MKILAIGAHPDDIEIFMYGILSIYSKRNDEINMIVATDGAAGNVTTNKNLSKIRKKETKEALKTFGNQITLTILLTVSFVIVGLWFINDLIPAFGGKGEIFEPAKIYYKVVLYGVPILALSMMGNNVIRAEGKPNFAMINENVEIQIGMTIHIIMFFSVK